MAFAYCHRDTRKLLVLVLYALVYLAVFIPSSESHAPVLLTLVVTSCALWFGPLALLEFPKHHRWYDPAVLFNTAVFYYSIKGVTLGYRVEIPFLRFIPDEQITVLYLRASIYIVGGLLAWNWLYHVAIKAPNREVTARRQIRQARLDDVFNKHWPKLVLGLSLIGSASFFMLFQSIGMGIGTFLENPLLRSYLTDGTLGIRSPFANFFVCGSYLFSLASILWLTACGTKNQRPGIPWFIHAFLSLSIFILIAGRANLFVFLTTLAIVYTLKVGNISKKVLILSGLAGAVYAYTINIWRAVMGTMNMAAFGAVRSATVDRFSFDGLFNFLAGTDLTDIRLFTFIIDNYGITQPFHWGDTLLGLVYGFVPRALWVNKPLDLSLEISALSEGYGAMAGTPPGFFPEMFMNFHVVGVILGGALLGWGFGVLYRKWILRSRGALPIILYSLVGPSALVLPSATFENVLTGLAIPIFAFIVAMRVAEALTAHNVPFSYRNQMRSLTVSLQSSPRVAIINGHNGPTLDMRHVYE